MNGNTCRPLLCLVAAFLAAVPSLRLPAGAAVPPGLTKAEPIVCSGRDHVVLRGRFIETSGTAVVVNGYCDVKIVDSHIVAGGVGILAQGYADVTVTNSYVEGGQAALSASGRGKIVYRGTEVRGATLKSGRGEIVGDGKTVQGSTTEATGLRQSLDDAAAALENVRIGCGGLEVRDGDNKVTIGGDGLVVDDGTDTVKMSAGRDGLRVETDGAVVTLDADVSIEGDTLRLGLGGSVEVSGDWRTAAHSSYGVSDTDRLLLELGAEEEDGELRTVLGGDVLFDVDSTAIRPAGEEALRKVAHVVRQRAAGEIRLVGHTDSLGSGEHNLKLSQARAVAVMRWLHREEGIPVELMAGQGMGAKQPLAYNTMPDGSDNPEGRAENRRVEIYFTTRN